jgi:predicted peptidase
MLTAGPLAADEPSPPRLVRQAYESATGEAREYLVYLPAGYESEPERRWPLLLFLHGDGERGDAREDLNFVLVHGPLYEAWVQKHDLELVIVSPQLPLYGRDETMPYLMDRDPAAIPRRLDDGVPPREPDFPTPQPMAAKPAEVSPLDPEGPPDGWPRIEADLLAILDQAQATYRTDPARVYLTGLSYGGFGTWYLAAKHPERFAAIAPVAGWGHPDHVPALAEHTVPVWAFAGGRDELVPPRFFYESLNELERRSSAEVLFTVHEDMGHDVWKRVYAGRDLYEWLLRHRLRE